MEEMDHSGFVLDKHQMEYETLDSKIAKGMLKFIPTDVKRKINFLEEIQYKNRNVQCSQTGTSCFKYCRSSTSIKLRSICSDLLNVEMYNDNLKMFNQVWEETLLILGNDSDEPCLGELHRETSEKANTHEERCDIVSARHCSEKGAEKLPKIKDYDE